MTQFDLLRLTIREGSGRLSPTQKAVLIHLIDRANSRWQCWPSQSLLSEQTGFGVRAVRQSIRDLMAAGLITLVSSGKGRTNSNTYSINVGAITQLSEQGSHSDEETEAESHPSGKEIGNEVPHLEREIGNEVPHLDGITVGKCGEIIPSKGGTLFPALGHEMPLLRQEVPLLRHEVPLTEAGGAYKERQEEIQEEIHEDRRRTKLKAKENDPDNTGHTSGDQQRFVLPPDWMPNDHLLMEQAEQRSLEGLFNLNKHYRREMLNKFKKQYTGKKGVCKTAEEWHQVFCKSIEVQLRIDGVAV